MILTLLRTVLCVILIIKNVWFLDELEPGTIVMTEGEEVAKREIDQDRAKKGSKVDNVMNAEERLWSERPKRA